MTLTLRRTPRTAQGFIEPLELVGDVLPLHMVVIPGGTFMMGSPDDEPERSDAEGPQHEVTLSPFFMGRYPITQAQYEAVMGANPAADYGGDRFVAADQPVVGGSWDQAVQFCQRLAQKTGRPYRLPSEAEWEYACRAGTTTPFYFGKTLTTEIANYDGNYTYGPGTRGEYRQATTPVNHFGIANAFGLSDMHGNVWEWCQDAWHDNYEGAPRDGSAWLEGGGSSRVLRGGSWYDGPQNCRSADRGRRIPAIHLNYFGFRVCCGGLRGLAPGPRT